jgi:hypothetical protein
VGFGGLGRRRGEWWTFLSLSLFSSADFPEPCSAEVFYIASGISQTQAVFEHRRERREISSSSFLPLLW